MAEPTQKQRRVWAKQGIAMPDGSYYIRNAVDLGKAIEAVGRATPNAGESDVARRNAVRRHIIKRANDLKLSSKIPDTWASDGSLKEPATAASHAEIGEAFLVEHFGRKGMHWGEHVFQRDAEAKAQKQAVKIQSQHDQLISTAKEHETIAAAHKAVSEQIIKDASDLIAQRENSALFKANYGPNSHTEGDTHFYFRTGMSKSVAASQLHNRALQQSGMFARSAANHEQIATAARTKAADLRRQMQHDAGEAFIQHFGRKGMKWGEHVFGRDRGSGTATVHPDVARARAAQTTIQKHGLSAVSNNELRDLNKRTQLETDYARLHMHTSEGKKFVQQLAKEQGKNLATGYIQKYGPKGVSWLIKNGIKVTVGAGKHKG